MISYKKYKKYKKKIEEYENVELECKDKNTKCYVGDYVLVYKDGKRYNISKKGDALPGTYIVTCILGKNKFKVARYF